MLQKDADHETSWRTASGSRWNTRKSRAIVFAEEPLPLTHPGLPALHTRLTNRTFAQQGAFSSLRGHLFPDHYGLPPWPRRPCGKELPFARQT